jgi:transcription termination factor NusB
MNEMIELAKKYGDEGSSKLINGILHKVLTGAEEEKK